MEWFKKRTAASVPATSPGTGYGGLYVNSTDGLPHIYDTDASTDHSLVGVSTVAVTSGDNSIVLGGTSAAPTVGWKLPFQGLVTGASYAHLAAERGEVTARSNSGSAMTDTFPTLNGTTDVGWTKEIRNEDPSAAITITISGGALFRTSAGATSASFVLNYGCRQMFTWSGTQMLSVTGNANLLRLSGAAAAGHGVSFVDTTGRVVQDSGGTLSGNNTGDQTIALSGDVSGTGTAGITTVIGSHKVTNAMRTQMAAHTYKGNNTGSTADEADITATQLTADLNAATTSLQGMMSATDKSKMDHFFGNGWYNIQDYGVLPGGTASANVTAMNAFLATCPDNVAVYFPPGVYQFNAPWSTLTQDIAFFGVRGHTQIALTANMSGNFITLLNTGFYTSFTGIYFANFVTQTAGYVIGCQNNANVLFQDCFFVGAVGQTLAGCIDFTGTNSGNGAVLRSVYAAGFTGTAVNVASPLDTIYMQDLEIVNNAGGGSSVGVACSDGGAVEMVDCQIIQCGINLNLAPAVSKTVASVFASNCFFDQGRTTAMTITGAGTVTRSHFVACWFTLASTASGAKAIDISTTGSSAHAGLMFSECHILNTPTAGTSDGLVATAAADLTIIGCQIGGWVNGIQITPSTASATVLNIGNNIFGVTGGIAANTTGIKLNVGATTYGQVLVQGNSFVGNTTPLSDASTVAATSAKVIGGNSGMAVAVPARIAATAAINTTETYVMGQALPMPANSLMVGTTYRATLYGTCTSTAANVSTFTVRVGTSGTAPASDTTATAALATTAAATTGTAVAFRAEVLITVRAVGASTLLECALAVTNTGITGIQSQAGSCAITATGTFNNNTALFLNISYKTAAATTTSTFQLGAWEVVAQ